MQLIYLPLFFCALLGNKTIDMFGELDQGILSDYQTSEKTFIYKKKIFTIVTGNLDDFSTRPLAFIGSHPTSREIIYLDPSNSPLLENHYQEFRSQAFGNSLQILHALKTYIQNTVFTSSLLKTFFTEWISSSDRTLDDFTRTHEDAYIPVISIEAFIEKKVGVCRHTALVTTYFLDRLIKDGLLQGKAYLVRDLIASEHANGGHAWSLFIDADKQAWHIDVLWDVIKNINDPFNYQFLCSLYGENAMDYQVQRYQLHQ